MKLTALCAIGAVAFAVSAITPAAAHFTIGDYEASSYTYEAGTGCAVNKFVDPINVVFYGNTAYYENVRDKIRQYSDRPRWDQQLGAGGGNQQVRNPGHTNSCFSKQEDVSSRFLTASRYHMRLFQPDCCDTKGRFETAGDAHYETNDCNGYAHAVRGKGGRDQNGYDQARGRIYSTMIGRSFTRNYNFVAWGNTKKKIQCKDGNPNASDPDSRPHSVASDGNVAWIEFIR